MTPEYQKRLIAKVHELYDATMGNPRDDSKIHQLIISLDGYIEAIEENPEHKK